MADEKVNSGPEEVNAAEPEVTEEAAGSSRPRPPSWSRNSPNRRSRRPVSPAMAEPEPESPGGDTPSQGNGPEPEQPETAEPVMEDTPAQASLFGEDAPSAEQPEPLPLVGMARSWCLLKKSAN